MYLSQCLPFLPGAAIAENGDEPAGKQEQQPAAAPGDFFCRQEYGGAFHQPAGACHYGAQQGHTAGEVHPQEIRRITGNIIGQLHIGGYQAQQHGNPQQPRMQRQRYRRVHHRGQQPENAIIAAQVVHAFAKVHYGNACTQNR